MEEKYLCSHCGAELTQEEMTEFEGNIYCADCLNDLTTVCDCCGDSPLSLVHLPKYRLYVYASTDEILYKSLVDTKLFNEIKTGSFEEITARPGDILRILPNGKILTDTFSYTDYSDFHWWNYSLKDDYIEDLRSVAAYQGLSPEVVDALLDEGFMPEEIEDYIYCME